MASLAEAIDGTPFRADTFSPFLTDVEAARRQPLLQRADLNGTSLALRLDLLLVEASGRWLAMLPLRGVANDQALATTVAGYDDAGLVFLDLKAEVRPAAWHLSARGADPFAGGHHCHRGPAVDQPAIASADRRGAAAAGRRGDLHRCGSADGRGPVVDLQSVRIAAGRCGRLQLLPVLRGPLSRYRQHWRVRA